MGKLSDKPSIARLVEICYQRGLRRVILSPGSRNAPLSISFLGHGGFDVKVVGDERVAAFMGLGMSQTDAVATVLVCTSGSAMLNYAPAISEACYQRVPLLVITADRPEEWVDQMEGQTMRQQGALRNFVRKEFQLPQEAESPDRLWYSDRIVNEAITATTYPMPGPVHINVPLKEPLYGVTKESVTADFKLIHPLHAEAEQLAPDVMAELVHECQQYSKVMLIMGMMAPAHLDTEVLHSLSEKGIVVINEANSNAVGQGINSWIDRSIAAIPVQGQEQYLPELIITLGGPLVSKRIKTLLRAHHPAGHWHIDKAEAEIDLFQSLTRAIYVGPTLFLKAFNHQLKPLSAHYSSAWHSLASEVEEQHRAYLESCPFSDLQVYHHVLAALPQEVNLQMANSAAVRYVQIFPVREDIHYYGNRGVSGIEGCTSTAMGMAMTQERPVVLVTGDMAFRYDANAFWIKNRPDNLKCIVVNNGGGGIFKIIPGPDTTDHLETAFEARQENSARAVAVMYDIPYVSAKNEKELQTALAELFADDRTMILEIHTPSDVNAEVIRDYFNQLRIT